MSSRRLLIFALAALLVATTAAAQQARDAIERFGANARQTREIYDRLDTIGANIDRLADQNNVQRATLRAIAELLGAENATLTPQELVPLIAKRAADAAAAQDTMARLAEKLGALDPGAIRSQALDILKRAHTAFAEGRLEEAEKAFGELAYLRTSDLAGARRAWVEAVSVQAQVATLAGKNERASQLYGEAAKLLATESGEYRRDAWWFQMANASQWLEEGKLSGDNQALSRAAAIYMEQALLLTDRMTWPDEWALTHHDLGTLLILLGQRTSDADLLKMGIDELKLALEVRTRKRNPKEWSKNKSNLGSGLLAYGVVAKDISSIEEGAKAIELALEERPKETYPREWATSQLNLANAWYELGRARHDTALVDKALARYRDVLATFSPDRDPFNWAQTQVNLGRISLELGEEEQSNERLEVAVQALDAAAKLPASRIGGFLQAQALFHGGKAHFEIGSRTGSLEELALAAGRMAAARQAYAAIGDEYQSIIAQFNEAIAYGKWADIDRDEASIARARSAFQNVKERAQGAGQTDLVEEAGVMLERLPTQTDAAQ